MWHTEKYGLKISCISWVSFATAAFVDFNKPYVEIISLLTITLKNLICNILVALNWVINFSLRLKFPSQYWLWTFVSHKLSHLKTNCCYLSIYSGKVWIHFWIKKSGKGIMLQLFSYVFMRTHLLMIPLFFSMLQAMQ